MFKRTADLKRDEIVLEYLNSYLTLGHLAKKHGVKMRTIQTWVRKYRKESTGEAVAWEPADEDWAVAVTAVLPVLELEEPVLDISVLRKQVAQLSLKNELLEEILRLSSEQTGVDFKKKYGSRQF